MDLKPLLQAEIDTYKLKAGSDLEKIPWLSAAENQFSALETAIKNYEVQQGWKIYKNIKRLLIPSLDEQARINHARAVFNEANGKIVAGSWRQKSINELLGKNETSGSVDPATQLNWIFNESVKTENIVKASEILDEYQDNFYEKNTTLNRRISILSVVATMTVGLFIAIGPKVGDFQPLSEVKTKAEETSRSPAGEDDSNRAKFIPTNIDTSTSSADTSISKADTFISKSDTSVEATESVSDTGSEIHSIQQETSKTYTQARSKLKNELPKAKSEEAGKNTSKSSRKPIHESPRLLALLVIVTGLIGAVVSGLLRIIQTENNTSVPSYLFGNTILTARLVLASMASLAIYIFLGTGILMFLAFKISFELLLAFSFAAGFSEQLVQKGVEMLTKEEMYKGSKGHPST